MRTDYTKETSKVIRQQIIRWSEEMFTAAKGRADINSVMTYSPLIQMLNNELTSRYLKRTTLLALSIAGLSLLVSSAPLFVSYSTSTHNQQTEEGETLEPKAQEPVIE